MGNPRRCAPARARVLAAPKRGGARRPARGLRKSARPHRRARRVRVTGMSTPALVAPSSPYKGLASYGDSDLDAILFFGRERDREVILANLVASRLTVLYGPTGVGKSSVLRAGVVHRLRAARAHEDDGPRSVAVVVDRWRDAPARAIVHAVADEAARLGVVPPPTGLDEYLTLDEA